MVIKTFEAIVAGGRLEHEELPDELEGRRVRVTVMIGDAEAEERTTEREGEALNGTADEPEPPDWLSVETEIYVPMQGKVETIRDVTIIDRGRAQPTIILPEDLPDD